MWVEIVQKQTVFASAAHMSGAESCRELENAMKEPILEMRHICKGFPGVKANDDVNFSIYPGEIHALLGENGAGKSTLMNILTGIYKPDSGTIIYKGKPTVLKSPKSAVKRGIGMVHQHFRLVESLTVSENVYLGTKACKTILNLHEMHKRVGQCSDEFGLEVDPHAKIWQLSIGEQQRVEIVKLLFRGAEILILDEPTAVLTPQESVKLFETLRKMADADKAVVVISHKMNEVMANADRITVLRDGKSIDTLLRSETDEDALTQLMVGRELGRIQPNPDVKRGELVLKLDGVHANNDKGLPALDGLDLEVYGGEIVGIAGVAGNGQKELTEAITGLRKKTGGSVTLCGVDVTRQSAYKIKNQGVAFVPEDRLGMGLVPGLSAVENVMLRDFDTPASSRRGLVSFHKVARRAQEMVEGYDIKLSNIHRPVKLMSGGNQQKLLLAREISGTPKLLITSYPIRGLDIGATNSVHKILEEQRAKGVAVLLIAEDLEELFQLSDRIAVLFKGKITGVVERKDFSYDTVGHLMVGAAHEEEGPQHA